MQNSEKKNHWFYCEKLLKRANTNIKPVFFLEKRVVKPISSNGFGPWISHTRQEKLWGTLTAKLFREPLVLFCFRSKVLKKHWFYCVSAQKGWKTNGFIIQMQKSEKSIGFTVKKFKKEQKPL